MDSGAGLLGPNLFLPQEGCANPRGLGSFLGEGHRELGDRLIEARGLAAGDALDINLSSRNGQVNASPVLGLMT